MSEVVNIVVALAVVVFVIRWFTSGESQTLEEQRVRTALGFRPRSVTPEMAETIASMFPDMPRENIHYDLLRTGSVEQTTNKIIERGHLDPPPPGYFRIYPRGENQAQRPSTRPPSTAPISSTNAASHPQASSSSFVKSGPSLIERYHLQERLSSQYQVAFDAPEEAGGKSAWDATPERREANLRERKAQMVLAARKRLLEQEKAADVGGPGPSSSGAKSS